MQIRALSEATLRKIANEEGFIIRKSRRRKWTPEYQGQFMVLDRSTNIPVLGYHYDADLEDVTEFFTADEPSTEGPLSWP